MSTLRTHGTAHCRTPAGRFDSENSSAITWFACAASTLRFFLEDFFSYTAQRRPSKTDECIASAPSPGPHTSGGLTTAGCAARASMTALGSSIMAARQLTELQRDGARDADLHCGGGRSRFEWLFLL